MRFEVPQFIDVEDRIFGPLTLKQFIYLAGAAGFVAILYSFLPLYAAIFLGLPVIALSAALAFYRINERPFISVIESAIYYLTSKRLYLWKKEDKKPIARKETRATATPYVPKLSDSKLKDLAWSLDIKESIYRDTDQKRI